MPKKILYIGNKLSGQNLNVTTIDTLSLKFEELGYRIKSYSNQTNKLVRLLSMLSAIIRHQNFDYVLIDTYSTSAFWFAWSSAKLCQLLGLKYIMILHGGNLPKRLKSHKGICKNIFGKAHLNITPSPYLFQEFKITGFSNLKLIPNHIDINNYLFKERNNIQPRLLWVRAFDHIYNPLMALKVLKQLLKEYPTAKLSMVGPSKDNSINECKKFAEEQNLPVEFTGKMSKEDWISYSKNFDIFINTTNVDNTPVSVIEAMALGLPVVSTNVAGIPYLLKHNQDALLVSAGNEIEMSKAVINLIEHPSLCNKLTKAARHKAEQFDWNIVKHKWQDVLK